MAKAKQATKRGGFHALGEKVHVIEGADRAAERERAAKETSEAEEQEVTAEVRPPPAHEE